MRSLTLLQILPAVSRSVQIVLHINSLKRYQLFHSGDM